MRRPRISIPPLHDAMKFPRLLPSVLLPICSAGLLAAISACSPSGGYCSVATHARQPVCSLSEAEQAAQPVRGEWWQPSLAVFLHPLASAAQRDGLRRAAGGRDGMGLSGLAVPDIDSGRCDLFVALPEKPEPRDYESVGHEAMHCFTGGYHPDMLSGKPASSYLSPQQASTQRQYLLAAVTEAEKQSRWTMACTFGIGGCPPPPPGPLRSMTISLHPSTPAQLGRIGQVLGGGASGGGIGIADPAGSRCDLYVQLPATYLGLGMERLGRRIIECYGRGPSHSAGGERRRALAERAWTEEK